MEERLRKERTRHRKGEKRKKIKEILHKKSEMVMKTDRQREKKDIRKIKQKDMLNKHKYE
jgi:hypothetical protein